uniref:Uncharacterized protein n=1 Tax=Anguilla anguilla TaxID=7936 RepID=A0A0E9WED2_ANGAN
MAEGHSLSPKGSNILGSDHSTDPGVTSCPSRTQLYRLYSAKTRETSQLLDITLSHPFTASH